MSNSSGVADLDDREIMSILEGIDDEVCDEVNLVNSATYDSANSNSSIVDLTSRNAPKNVDRFKEELQAATNNLSDISDDWQKTQDEKRALIQSFVTSYRKLLTRESRIIKKLHAFKKPATRIDPLRCGYESPADCQICLQTKTGHHMVYFQCSHYMCHSCLSQLQQHKCPECRTPFKTLMKFSKLGERFIMKQIPITDVL